MKMRGGVLLLALVLLDAAGPAAAQQLGDIEGKAKLSDAERAKRDADKVYQWIRFHADKAPAKPAKPAAATAPAPVAAKAAAPSPARPLVTEAAPAPVPMPAAPLVAETLLALPAAEQASSPVTLPAPLPPAAMPVAAAAPPEPEPEPEPERPLELLERAEPEYPRHLLKEAQNGTVQVRFVVQTDGSVGQVEALKSSHRLLVRPTLDAVKRWRFKPVAEAREAMVEVGFRSE